MMIVFAPNHFGNGRSHRIHEFIRQNQKNQDREEQTRQ
jgi:hypothetical protein